MKISTNYAIPVLSNRFQSAQKRNEQVSNVNFEGSKKSDDAKRYLIYTPMILATLGLGGCKNSRSPEDMPQAHWDMIIAQEDNIEKNAREIDLYDYEKPIKEDMDYESMKDTTDYNPIIDKFMKKDNTESNLVAGIIDRIALSHPEISFKLIKDGKQVTNTPGDKLLKSACFEISGTEFTNSALDVDYELNGVKVSGFVSKPTAAKKTRGWQYFFLNGRYIQTKTAMAALEQAYKNRIMVGMHPACVLNIEIDPSFVDVNVHPSKIEVRFSDEQAIFRGVYYAVMSALDADVSRVEFKKDVAKPVEQDTFEQQRFNIPEKPVEQKKQEFFVNTTASEFKKDFEKQQKPLSSFDIPFTPTPKLAEEKTVEYIPAPKAEEKREEKAVEQEKEQKPHINFKYVGEVFSTYILVECDDKMIIIDKHAAHERIIFERLKENAQHNPQLLLVPFRVSLSAEQYEAVISNVDEINSLGFEIEDYGTKTVLVRSVPMELDKENVAELIEEIAGKLCEKFTDFSPEFLDWLYHSVACRAAIKAGNKSGEKELSALADIVLNDDRIRYCPHGRPTAAEMTLNEFKKRFSRI